MSTRGVSRTTLLSIVVACACALSACRGETPGEPSSAAPTASATYTREQASEALMALPELKAWAARIEKAYGGAVRGALIEDDPAPRNINGKNYWQFSFVENRSDAVHRWESFLVAQDGGEILVEDFATDTTLTLNQWRRDRRPMERVAQ
jgi:hypothetical protein